MWGPMRYSRDCGDDEFVGVVVVVLDCFFFACGVNAKCFEKGLVWLLVEEKKKEQIVLSIQKRNT